MKLMTILGTRPDLIKMSRVLPVLDQTFEHTFVHTGQNYDDELYRNFLDELHIRQPDYYLAVAEENVAQTVSNIIARADAALEDVKPDAVLFYGDTNSVMAAYPAKRRKIPIFHMEAGNRSFNPLVPEEINRRIIDHLADVNMVNSEHARRYLLAEGFPPDRIIKTGSPMMEVLFYNEQSIVNSEILEQLGVEPRKYFVVSMHREANVDDIPQLSSWVLAINALVEHTNMPVIFSCHPRTRKRLKEHSLILHKDIQIMAPLGFFDYVNLQLEAACTISDSGTITEEASLLEFPAVTIRQAHERPEGMDEGTVAMCSIPEDLEAIVQYKMQEHQRVKIVADYDVPQVSCKVVNTILSYIDFVNRVVWRQY